MILTKSAPGRVEFHVSRKARDKYQFDNTLFSATGNVIFADFQAALVFAQKMNAARDLELHPEAAVHAAQVNAMGLIDEMLHMVVQRYREQVNPAIFQQGLQWLHEKLGQDKVEETLRRFVEDFPPVAVYQGKISVAAYLDGETEGIANRQTALEELLMLWLANINPAFAPFLELFDDQKLELETSYRDLVQGLTAFFREQPTFGPGGFDLLHLLRQPAIQRPHSLAEQVRFMTEAWGPLLDKVVLRLLGGLDFIKEETKPVFPGPPPTEVLHYEEFEYEPEQFSPDLDWMPNLVLLAKSTLVWLDQLSKMYERDIARLDQIPDEELDRLARWGFTGLWLIGIWERSPASKKIKQSSGNPEAESSAYSLFDYEVAHELGGFDALQKLKDRCWQRGIRMTCDMVPNHTGIDSRWVREHPDWFVSLPFSPFPGYAFSGQDLSGDPRYRIFIEDGYYSQSDAAVVFKREDRWRGEVRYIYHGNDGTGMPWNDTAQLDYLNPEVREAVIRKIVEVARMFPVIRFDAAMTLAKKHFHRLWYPEPGSGGDIPSRSQFGMTKYEFNQKMQNEFWREVVDRVATEVPDCLLLAEAFWMMEGYFVRTLGMHRVYNSAFMNMLKNEENEKYRQTVINTLQFNPEILKRYVNFLNNPDEDTAIAQFGDGDKYFGVCLMLVTMPGLPMFGHGQVEGLHEKYGMEYRRAHSDEEVNQGLVHRHEQQIFPLMKKRYLFAEVENFLFYDFMTPDGGVNPNVFVYSNRAGGERALVLYNNKFEHATGWVRVSVPFAEKLDDGDEVRLVQKSLRQGLGLPYDAERYLLFRDQISGLEFIRSCKEIGDQGLYFELAAYQSHVLVNIYEIPDNDEGHYGQLCAYLNGRGVPGIAEELREISLKPLLKPFDALLNPDAFEDFLQQRLSAKKAKHQKDYLDDFEDKYKTILNTVSENLSLTMKKAPLVKSLRRKLAALLQLGALDLHFKASAPRGLKSALTFLQERLRDDRAWALLFCWLVTHELGKIQDSPDDEARSAAWLKEWLLTRRLARLLQVKDTGEDDISAAKLLLEILVVHQNWASRDQLKGDSAHELLKALLRDYSVPHFAGINRFDGTLWFNKEKFDQLAGNLFLIAMVQIMSTPKLSKPAAATQISQVHGIILKWQKAEEKSEYRLEKLLDLLLPKARKSPRKTASKVASRKKRPGKRKIGKATSS